MVLPAFDTHAYVKTLKSVGFTEQQAEAQAELNSKILFELVTEKLATKDDFAEFKQAVNDNIAELKHSIKSYGIGIVLLGIFITIVNFIHVFIPTFHV